MSTSRCPSFCAGPSFGRGAPVARWIRRLAATSCLALAVAGAGCRDNPATSEGAPADAGRVPTRLVFATEGAANACDPRGDEARLVGGALKDARGKKIRELAEGCTYVGGQTTRIDGFPEGGSWSATYDVAAVSGSSLRLVPSAGNGPRDCTEGAGPERHCLNRAGRARCSSDADCDHQRGACAPDARCFVGAPAPIRWDRREACLVRVVMSGANGTADLATGASTIAVPVSARVFLAPCPPCANGSCVGGASDGAACESVGEGATSIDCLPSAHEFNAALPIVARLSTEASELTADAAGVFCPGQRSPGAFGEPEARVIAVSGTRTKAPLDPEGARQRMAAVFCIPPTGNPLVDRVPDLPGPGVLALSGSVSVRFEASDASGPSGRPANEISR